MAESVVTVKETMTKLMATGSHFELVSGTRFEEVDIVQIYPKKVYVNVHGSAVFLCEVIDESED